MEDCLFCQIIEGEKPSKKVYEDENSYAFLDVNPRTKGHVLVVPKKHSRTLKDLTPEQTGKLFESVNRVAEGVVEALDIDGFNILQANEKPAGQYIEHVHVHIIPRRKDDDFKIDWKYEAEEEELEEVHKKISRHLG